MQSQNLLSEINSLISSNISKEINARYVGFKSFEKKPEEDWFSELCFCLTTANSSAMMGIKVQGALGFEGFYNLPLKKLSNELRALGYRFYNRRAEFIIGARQHFGIKAKLGEFADDRQKRQYLAENVKGLGFKESSHFLRNTGHDNVAILDRHILRIMHEHGLINVIPKTINAKNYVQMEQILDRFLPSTGLNHSTLDLSLWYLKTGKILK